MKMKKWIIAIWLMGTSVVVNGAIISGKTYSIMPEENTSKSLFVNNSSKDEHAPVVLWTETKVPAQQWTVEESGNGEWAFQNVYTGKYLNVSGKFLVQTTEKAYWTLEKADEDRNIYYIKNGEYLHASSRYDGRQPFLGAAQTWQMVEVQPQSFFDATAPKRMADAFLQQYLQDKGNGHNTFNNGGWNEAETMETILDMYERTKDPEYLTVYENCYKYMKYHVGNNWTGGVIVGGYDWFGYDFNDDVMWMIIGAARAYLLTGKQAYLNDAKKNFDLIWNRANLGYIDMLRWAELTGDRNGTNSCINGPAEVAACYIALGTGDDSYFEKARMLYANQRQYLFEPETGRVYDSIIFDPETVTVTNTNTWASTYNQGTMLGAAVLLYRHFGDAQYKEDADKIIAYAKRELCNADGVVRVCQNVDGDFQGFKGILMRYAGLYAREYNDADYISWLKVNAFHAFNNINSRSFGHSAWLTKASEDMMYDGKDYSKASSSFGASTALAAAFAVPLDTLTAVSEISGPDEKGKQFPLCHSFSQGYYNISGIKITDAIAGSICIHGKKKYLIHR